MLKGKTAVITGGAKGIGKAIALEMAANGANIALVDFGSAAVSAETCELIRASGVQVKSYSCDVADHKKTEALVEQILADFGSIDILVNNAGITSDKLIISMAEEDFDKVIAVNLKGAFNMIRHICPVFMRRRGGRIINITSVAGMMGNAGQANYAAAKAGVIGLTKTVAKEFASRNITCNAIAPGFIRTDMTGALPEKVQEAAVGQIPMKRMGEPADIAHLAVFLAGLGASYITGEVIKADGGLYI
ncbi:MAG: 3-oxoacyl-[acyl-carrier-protein] reductase [Clostridia bacterium]|nr:3-oxoacyl-[acyl-carrier-protein] reductase [Clostridia bacterium]